jgi:hypothetical protein
MVTLAPFWHLTGVQKRLSAAQSNSCIFAEEEAEAKQKEEKDRRRENKRQRRRGRKKQSGCQQPPKEEEEEGHASGTEDDQSEGGAPGKAENTTVGRCGGHAGDLVHLTDAFGVHVVAKRVATGFGVPGVKPEEDTTIGARKHCEVAESHVWSPKAFSTSFRSDQVTRGKRFCLNHSCHDLCIIRTRPWDIQMIEGHLDRNQTAVFDYLSRKDTAPKNAMFFTCLHFLKSDTYKLLRWWATGCCAASTVVSLVEVQIR